MVLLGLALAPFLPASNLLFFVGTFIGERLMYMPSIGFCLLLGEGLAVVLEGTHTRGGASAARRWAASFSRTLVALGCIAMLTAYAAKTYSRNWDWLTEEHLFLSAQKVGNSWVEAFVPFALLPAPTW